LDTGPHLFHTSNQDIAAYWEDNFPGEFRFPALFGGNYVDGKVFDYPLTKDSIAQLPKDTQDAVRAEWVSLNPEGARVAKNYKEYIEAIAGPTLQKLFYEEYPKKLWGIDTEKLSANWAPQRIEIRDERRPFHGAQWCGVALEGCGRIAEILRDKILEMGGQILFGEPVTAIEAPNNSIRAIVTSLHRYPIAENEPVISTTGIDTLSGFLDIQTGLKFRGIKLVSLVTEGPDPLPVNFDWLYFQDPNLVFHRIGSQNRFSSSGIASGLAITTAEVAYSPGDSIHQLSDAELIELCINDLSKINLLPVGNLRANHVIDVGPVYPGYEVGYEEELRSTVTQLERFENLYFSGSLAEFAYSDLQILFAKSLDLAARLSNPEFNFNHVKKSSRRINGFSPKLSIDGTPVGGGAPPYLIAEIGLNHNGSITTAKKLIDHAVESGFSAVKLQTYLPGRASSKAEDARYKEDLFDLEESLDQIFDRLVLSREVLEDIFAYAETRGITAFSTPFDASSAKVLNELSVPAFKISSMDLVNLPLIQEVAGFSKPVILSTGMSSIVEIEEALEVVRSVGNPDIILLHCVSSYPTPASESNLLAIKKLAEYFGLLVGYSDHSSSNALIPAAIALGATVVEKHVTVDRRMKGPDHIFSLEPEGMRELAELSRTSFYALGDGRKRVMPSELGALRSLRRSLFAAEDLRPGTVLSPEMLVVKSPGTGILPKYLDLIIGRELKHPVPKDYPLTWTAV
jgi:sialic acid synthase SpsE/protoporphyrinogen oxidase